MGETIAARTFYRADPLYLWLPVVGLTILVLALSLLGDAVRDAFDPRPGADDMPVVGLHKKQ